MSALHSQIKSRIRVEIKPSRSATLTTKFSQSRTRSEARKSASKEQLKKHEILSSKKAKKLATDTQRKVNAKNFRSSTLLKSVSLRERIMTALTYKSKLDIEKYVSKSQHKARKPLSKYPEKSKLFSVKMSMKPNDAWSKWRIKPKYTSKRKKEIDSGSSEILGKHNVSETGPYLAQYSSRNQTSETVPKPYKNNFLKFPVKLLSSQYSSIKKSHKRVQMKPQSLSSKCLAKPNKPLSEEPIRADLRKFKFPIKNNRSVALAQLKPKEPKNEFVLRKSISHGLIKSEPDEPKFPKQTMKLNMKSYVAMLRIIPRRSFSDTKLITPSYVFKYLMQTKYPAPNVRQKTKPWRPQIESYKPDSNHNREQMADASKSSSKHKISLSAKQSEPRPLESHAVFKESAENPPSGQEPGQSQGLTVKWKPDIAKYLAETPVEDAMPGGLQAPIQPAHRLQTRPGSFETSGQNQLKKDDFESKTANSGGLSNKRSYADVVKGISNQPNKDDSGFKPSRSGILSNTRSLGDVVKGTSTQPNEDDSKIKPTHSAILSRKPGYARLPSYVILATSGTQDQSSIPIAETGLNPEPSDKATERKRDKEGPPVKPKPEPPVKPKPGRSTYIGLLQKDGPMPLESEPPIQPPQKETEPEILDPLAVPRMKTRVTWIKSGKDDSKIKVPEPGILSSKRSYADVAKETSEAQDQGTVANAETDLNPKSMDTKIEQNKAKEAPPVKPKPDRSNYMGLLRKEGPIPLESEPPNQALQKEMKPKTTDRSSVASMQTQSTQKILSSKRSYADVVKGTSEAQDQGGTVLNADTDQNPETANIR